MISLISSLLQPVFILLLIASTITGVSAQINKGNVNQTWNTDTSNASIPLDELWIFLKRDKIKPIDDPEYYSKTEASGVFFENEPVVAVIQDSSAPTFSSNAFVALMPSNSLS